MSLEMEYDIITLTDDEGEEYELAHLDTLTHEDVTYLAFTPADAEDEEMMEIVILKVIESDEGEEILSTLDSDEEAEKIYEMFVVRLEQEEDEELLGELGFEDGEDEENS